MVETLFYIIVSITVLDFLVERILDFLNTTRFSEQLPKEVEGIYNPDDYRKSQQYLKTNHRFGMLTSAVSFVTMMAMLVFGGFAWLDGIV